MRNFIIGLALFLVATTASAVRINLPEEVGMVWPVNTFFATLQTIALGDPYVDLHYDSPGGEVDAALKTLQVMELGRANGVKYRCYVDGKAMSAAFFILTACDERYATRKSTFMIHEMWFFANPSMFYPTIKPDVMAFLAEASAQQEFMNKYQAERMRVSWERLRPFYEEEVVFGAYDLVYIAPGFINISVE